MTNPERPTDPMWLAEEVRRLRSEITALRRLTPGQGRYCGQAAEESTSSTTFVSLGDEVIVRLPEFGLIVVNFRAWLKHSTGATTADVGLFLDSTQVIRDGGTGGVQTGTTSTSYRLAVTDPNTATGMNATTSASSDALTGQVFSQALKIFADAGTYTVGMRFQTGGAGTALTSNRRLLVHTEVGTTSS